MWGKQVRGYICISIHFIVAIKRMQRLVSIVVALGLLVSSQAQIQCYTQGNAGLRGDQLASVLVVFTGAVTSTYQGNETVRAFDAYMPVSSRPLLIETASISGTNVTLSFRLVSTFYDSQTGYTLHINYTDLGFGDRWLSVDGTRLSSGFLCVTQDRSAPVLQRLVLDGFVPIPVFPTPLVLIFSEPVKSCSGLSVPVSSLSLSAITTDWTHVLPYGSSFTSTWYFNITDADGSSVVSIASGVFCDAQNNTQATSFTLSSNYIRDNRCNAFHQNYAYYDLNRDGRVDALLYNIAFAYNSSLFPLDVPRIAVNGINVSNSRVIVEQYAVHLQLLIAFDDMPIQSSGTVTATAGFISPMYGLMGSCLPSLTRTAFSQIPVFPVSAALDMGSSQVTVTVSDAFTPALVSSLLGVRPGISFANTVSATNTSIVLRLNSTIRSVSAFSSSEIYLVPLVWNTVVRGFPLWRPVSLTPVTVSRAVITRVGTGAWDTLTLTLASAFSASDLSTASLSIVDTSAIEYTVETAVALSSTQARFTVSQVCLNASEPCIDTSPSILYNVSIGNQSATLLATEAETAAPVFVGASAAVGSNIVRVRFSEPVVGWSPSALFSGLSIASIVDGPIAGWEKTLTLSRSIKAADLTKEWLETELVDVLGNTDTEVPLIFAVTATAHDDDGDGLVTRIRLTTSRQHQAFSSSDAFVTVPAMTLGAVTRVSTTVSDIAVTQHAVTWGSSLSIQYKSHASVGARVLLSADLRGGLELPLTTFSVESSEEALSSGSSSFSDLSTATQAGIIAGIVAALLAGILLGSYWRTARVTTKKKHRHELMQDSSDIELE